MPYNYSVRTCWEILWCYRYLYGWFITYRAGVLRRTIIRMEGPWYVQCHIVYTTLTAVGVSAIVLLH